MRLALILLPIALSACGTADRLSRIGRPPAVSPVTNPAEQPGVRNIAMPTPAPQEPIGASASLWRTGSRTFLRDQRAAQVGDLITVLVSIADEAQLQNRTQATRTGTQNMGMANLLGLETSIPRVLPSQTDPSSLINTNSSGVTDGNGQIRRSDAVTLRLAATVTQMLPNGNMVVAGRQEVRVNHELRELLVQGVLRPQDIGSDNTVRHDRLAEARIVYGGRGALSDVQQPRVGTQILDALLPF
jgi:flagellar L-ring protein precursor FlgH